MAQKIQESIPEQLYTNINLHSDSENIVNDNNSGTAVMEEFPAASSELKTSKKTNSLQRFFWRKKSDIMQNDGPADVENKVENGIPTSESEKRFLNARRLHLHLGRHIPRKRSDSLPKREHGEMDLLKNSSAITKPNNNNTSNDRRGSGLRSYFATYWNYIFSKNKNNTNYDEIYERSKPTPTDETENKLKSVISSNPSTTNPENKFVAVSEQST